MHPTKPFFVTVKERKRRFESLEAAMAYTTKFFNLYGIILGIGKDYN